MKLLYHIALFPLEIYELAALYIISIIISNKVLTINTHAFTQKKITTVILKALLCSLPYLEKITMANCFQLAKTITYWRPLEFWLC